LRWNPVELCCNAQYPSYTELAPSQEKFVRRSNIFEAGSQTA
jgi:hypothetical protein